ncbi:hypothetical protein PLICRDRAFT_700995 [Plicaturopsis crispa FD-325 SS-3]|nr:hypothetical protein PLICRDRAFT_700995 [Plicaturopsis crispa FD-325 SS-3]
MFRRNDNVHQTSTTQNTTRSSSPLRALRIASLLSLLIWSIVSLALSIRAVVKANAQKRLLRDSVPAGTQVYINTNDIFRAGVVITVISALLTLLSLYSLFTHFTHSHHAKRSHLRAQSLLYAFLALWLFATLIAFDKIFASRSARVGASIGGTPVPASVIQSIEQRLGTVVRYRKIRYLRLVAILPWLAVLSAAVTAAAHYLAARRPRTTSGIQGPAGVREKNGRTVVDDGIVHGTGVNANANAPGRVSNTVGGEKVNGVGTRTEAV